MRALVLGVFAAGAMLVGCDSSDRPRSVHTSRETEVSTAAITRSSAVRSKSMRPRPSTQESRSTASLNIADQPTTEPTVLVSGSVLYTNSSAATSATVELWLNSGEYGRIEPDSVRLDAVRVSKEGNYALRGADRDNLRVIVRNAPLAISEVTGRKPETTASAIRKLTRNFTLPDASTLSGKVLTQDDQPVEGALISFQSDDIEQDYWFFGNQQTTSTLAGNFELPSVAAGAGTIGAIAPGGAAVTEKIVVPTSGPVVLRLTTATAVISGTVLQFPSDMALAAGTVEALPETKGQVLGLSPGTSAVISANGNFRLENLPAGPLELGVKSSSGNRLWPAPGVTTGAFIKLSAGETTATTLQVFEGFTVAGTVYDKDTSEPLAGANVKVGQDRKAIAQSDANGQFTIRGLKPALAYDVSAELPQYAVRLEGESQSSGKLEAKPTTSSTHIIRDIPMQRLVTISGRVENNDAFPIPHALVRWRTSYGRPTETTTDANGNFILGATPFSEGLFEAEAAGYAFHRTTETLKVIMDDVKDVLITLGAGAVVEGRVVNNEGNPVPGAYLSSSDEYVQIGGTLSSGPRSYGKCDAFGQFRIEGLQNKKQTIRATAKGYGNGTVTVELKAGETRRGVEIKLPTPPEGIISGRVVDEEDVGVNANVLVMIRDSYPPYAATDADGNFELKGISESKSEVELLVSAQDPPRQKQVKATVGTRDLLIKFDDDAILFGRVIDGTTGEAIEKFHLSGFGSWSMAGMGPGEFTGRMKPKSFNNLTIAAPVYATQTFKVKASSTAGEFEQVFEMSLGGGVKGRVVDGGTNKPVSGVPVAAYELSQAPDVPAGSTVTGEDGTFLISRLPPGKVRVSAMPAAPLAPANRSVEIMDGNVADIGDIEIGASGSISGQVLRLPLREPVKGSHVNLTGPEGDASVYTIKTTGEDGRYLLDGLTAGTYKVQVNSKIFSIELAQGEHRTLDIELGYVRVKGQTTKAGKPIQLQVELRGNTGDIYKSYPSVGSYTMSNVRPGRYIVTLSSEANADGTSGTIFQEELIVPDQPEFVKDFLLP